MDPHEQAIDVDRNSMLLESQPESTDIAPQESGTIFQKGMLICIGIFVTTFATDQRLAKIPLRSYLKNQLHLDAKTMAAFFAIVGFAWYLKPIAGIIADAIPLFGTRRRHYLLLASFGGAVAWAVMVLLPTSYMMLLYAVLIANVFTVLGSTVIGGILVDLGKEHQATGRLSAYRLGVMNLTVLLGFIVGGRIATMNFSVTALLCAGCLVIMGICVFPLLPEKPQIARSFALSNAWSQSKTILTSGSMWGIVSLTFLFYVAPGFQSLLYYYQQNRLHMSDATIGNVSAVNAAMAILGGLSYAVVCKHWNLRTLLFVGILINAAASLFYLFYTSPISAYYIEAANGFVSTLGLIPLYDVAARATPKGSEALGYSLIMAIGNFGIAMSDIAGTWIAANYHVDFIGMVWMNFLTTAVVLFLIPLLPATLFAIREGQRA